MRAASLLAASTLLACSSTPSTPSTTVGAPAGAPVGTPVVAPDASKATAEPRLPSGHPDDADGDSVVDQCDQCPDSAEVFNGLDDLDGCPDSPDDQVVDHPTNRYAQPIVMFDFEGGSTTPSTPFVKWEIPDDVESIACIGVSREDSAVARARAKALCDHLRTYLPRQRPKLTIVELAVHARPTYRRENGGWFGGNAELRVLRAAGVEIWRRDGDQLVEMMPRKTKNPRPITPACRAMPPREKFHRNRSE